MKKIPARRPIVLAAAGTAALALALGGTAYAATLLTGQDIKDNSLFSVDVATNTLTYADVKNESLRGTEIQNKSLGFDELSDAAVARIRDAGYSGQNWGVILRNTQADGSAMLRPGPFAGPQTAEGAVKPPRGVGSLQIQTGDGDRDKVAFGNEVDFVGDKLSDIGEVGFSVFSTGENANAAHTGTAGTYGNLPNITFEIDPNLATPKVQSGYASLVFVPTGDVAYNNRWHTYDATEAAQGSWFVTGAAGGAATEDGGGGIGCNQGSMCTWAQIQERLAGATLFSAAVAKGSDHEFQGAVDELRIDDKTYDFEPHGVLSH